MTTNNISHNIRFVKSLSLIVTKKYHFFYDTFSTHTTGSIGFAIGIPAAEDHQYPIHLPPVLVIPFGNTVLEHRTPILRSFRFDNDRFHREEQRKKKYHS